MRERATEIEYLRYFYQYADFGPGDSDVRDWLKESFMNNTGKNIPEGYNYKSDGETVIDKP